MDALNLPDYHPPRSDGAYWELRTHRNLLRDQFEKVDYVIASVYKRRVKEIDKLLQDYEKAHGVPPESK